MWFSKDARSGLCGRLLHWGPDEASPSDAPRPSDTHPFSTTVSICDGPALCVATSQNYAPVQTCRFLPGLPAAPWIFTLFWRRGIPYSTARAVKKNDQRGRKRMTPNFAKTRSAWPDKCCPPAQCQMGECGAKTPVTRKYKVCIARRAPVNESHASSHVKNSSCFERKSGMIMFSDPSQEIL